MSDPLPTVPGVEITESRIADVGGATVRRALPRRERRTIGAWCFVDHMGPAQPSGRPDGVESGVGPHPHIGLQTVTWLLDGELLHRDSLGSEQVIRPGQLNLMTAGRGIAHAEESTRRESGALHGMQLWVAQPAATRHGDAAFEHHGELPQVDVGEASATVLVGAFGGVESPARRDTEHVGVDLDVRVGATDVPLDPNFEYGLIVASGRLMVDGAAVTPGHLAYLGVGRDELGITASEHSRAMLIGGVPFPVPIKMWWNYVARTGNEIVEAHLDWTNRTARFGTVDSALAPIDVAPPPFR